ncbi:MAG: S41 family peptidase [Synergistaceae bacterium]|nr:S41 family peptidase [Synergistaceae bacterium]
MERKTALPLFCLKGVILTLLFTVFYLCWPGIAAEGGTSFQNDGYAAPIAEDFSELSWSESFEKLHKKFSCEYAFTDWKKIDWEYLYKKIRPKIDNAQKSNDFTAYYLALKEYLFSIPDGHVRMTSIHEIDNKFIGGGFGFSAVKLSDGKLIANWVDRSGEAYAKGMRPGAEIIEWDGRPVEDVLNKVPVIFGCNPATDEALTSQKVRYLTRAPINTSAAITFSNIDRSIEKISLCSYDDKGLSLRKNYPDCIISDGLRDLILDAEDPQDPPAAMVEKRVLPRNIGYIRLWGELDLDLNATGETPSTLGLFRDALSELKKAKVRGLILDIRNNVGGLDSMVADILASFYTEKVLYEYQNSYNTVTGRMEICPDPSVKNSRSDYGLYINPEAPNFKGPVVALINLKCVSSGEGLAKGIKDLLQGETVGFYGTNGSFGLAGSEAKISGGIIVHWPYGQSLDKNKEVQIDSRNGEGGVLPSIRIPMTLNNALKISEGVDVELERAVEVINSYAFEHDGEI